MFIANPLGAIIADIWTQITLFLNPKSLARLASTSKTMNNLILQSPRYRELIRLHITNKPIPMQTIPSKFYRLELRQLLSHYDAIAPYVEQKKSLSFDDFIEARPIEVKIRSIEHNPRIKQEPAFYEEVHNQINQLAVFLNGLAETGQEQFFYLTVKRLQLPNNIWMALMIQSVNKVQLFLNIVKHLNSVAIVTEIIQKIGSRYEVIKNLLSEIFMHALLSAQRDIVTYLINKFGHEFFSKKVICINFYEASLATKLLTLDCFFDYYLDLQPSLNLLILLIEDYRKNNENFINAFNSNGDVSGHLRNYIKRFDRWDTNDQIYLINDLILAGCGSIVIELLTHIPVIQACALLNHLINNSASNFLHLAAQHPPALIQCLLSFFPQTCWQMLLMRPDETGRNVLDYGSGDTLYFMLAQIQKERRREIITRRENSKTSILSGFQSGKSGTIEQLHLLFTLLSGNDIAKIFTDIFYIDIAQLIINKTKKQEQLNQWILNFSSQDQHKLLNTQNSTGQNIMHILVQENNIERVRWLLDRHPENLVNIITAKDDHQRTSLHYAAAADDNRVVELLLQAIPHQLMSETLLATDATGLTVLDWATRSTNPIAYKFLNKTLAQCQKVLVKHRLNLSSLFSDSQHSVDNDDSQPNYKRFKI